MTFTVRIRGDVEGTIATEFLCDEHGRFTREISRAVSPDCMACPVCGAPSPWSMSAPPAGKLQLVTAGSMGRTEARPNAGIMDTRSMADGQSYRGWKRDRAKYWEGVRQRQVKELKQG